MIGRQNMIDTTETAATHEWFHGDAGRPFDPSSGAYFTLSRDWAETYARTRAEIMGAIPVVTTARLGVQHVLIDDDVVEWIGYEPEKVLELQENGYDSVANASGTEMFVFPSVAVEVLSETFLAASSYASTDIEPLRP
jgi:hypothetical protein